MRDYGKVSPRFWIGETGRKLRKMPDAQRIAMYLMTAPMAEMTGVFYCPIATILNDVGAPCEGLQRGYEGPSEGLARVREDPLEGHQRGIEGVKRALEALKELNFCFYDFESEYVFVTEMARCQIAEKLKPTDNQVKGIRKLVETMPKPMRARFIERYNKDFSLGFDEEIEEKPASPLEAPSEPLRSQEQEQEQEQDIYKKSTDVDFSSASSKPPLSLDGDSQEKEQKPKRAPSVPMQKLVDLYNEKLGSQLGFCRQLNSKREANLRQRWKDVSLAIGSDDAKDILEGFGAFYEKVGRSNFLMGRKTDFKATFDWIHASSNYLKIYEGNYENGRHKDR